MHTNGASEKTGLPREGRAPTIARPRRANEPTHDLLVLSHGPDAEHAAPSNHACLNSFRSNSRIIPSGGRPKTAVGR
jgi:hypothetical protein